MKVIFNNHWNELNDEQIRTIKNNFNTRLQSIKTSLIEFGCKDKIEFILFGEKKLFNKTFYLVLISENIIGGLYIFEQNQISLLEERIQNLIFDSINSMNENYIFNLDWRLVFSKVKSKNIRNVEMILKELGELQNKSEIQNNSLKLKRDRQLIESFKSSFGDNKHCQLCGIEKTFLMENNEKYFEAHHLVPYNTITAGLFKKLNLDIYENLILLCSNCHRKLHFINSKERKSILTVLLSDERRVKFYFDYFNLNEESDYSDFVTMINDIYNLIFKILERVEDDE